jgi:Fe-S-cluster containining protein
MPDGQFLIASNTNGRCYYQTDDGMCSIYNERPQVCKEFNCSSREKAMTEVVERAKSIRDNSQYSHSGYCFGFIYRADRVKTISDVIIRDPDSKKELSIKPAQLFGNSEKEVKQRMIELLSEDFKKEDI